MHTSIRAIPDGSAAVRATDDDAATSRLSCVSKGYLQDAYASYFVKRPTSRPPLINIGTFVRTWAVDQLVERFLEDVSETPKQIISLGAGTDTRFFRLSDKQGQGLRNLKRYVEVDFAESTLRKAQTLKKQKAFDKHLPNTVIEKGGTSLRSDVYQLIPGDLLNFAKETGPAFVSGPASSLDPSIETLIIAECLFVYLPPEVTESILQWCTATFPSCAVVAYDPINFSDAFGRMMVNNLKTRGIQLLGSEAHSSVESQSLRLLESGFHHSDALSVSTIRKQVVPQTETERISNLEMLDEVEELDLVLSHYAVSWGASTESLQRVTLNQ